MKWQGRRGSRNIVDRRSSGGRVAGGVGGLGLVAIVLIGWVLGVDVTPLLNGATSGAAPSSQTTLSAADAQAGAFVSVTLADTEAAWADILAQYGHDYDPVTLVLFTGATASSCGSASEATGPFYCPVDQRIYLDTAFFTTLSQRLGAQGDFAAAYVVAHEVAHHVQDELGILGQANQIRATASQAQSNAISVRIELQADCYSGIWARYAQDTLGTLERGDIGEAMTAAAQIGDDTLQRNAGQRPMPDSFTHGTSAQRQRWFDIGYTSEDLNACDTFSAQTL
ncbi:Putative neutral zinc metallopeptidase [Aquimixticola soesokkakensis]|uniref:Putative neutral zinc metallopeptidase n=1 Tax=Aquimixticola soesokkakensis TaxID=1519096 RepID=A0A1Y5SIC1_9RHOB|nr:neutral zinc metallopeptidase [Aquimixticola soesokkakensis]SLN40319.1 Putative neutral zinc metallopeptidase [Aquimixticola soesokkakensis]